MSTLVTVPTKHRHRPSELEFFCLNIGTSDIGHFTRIGLTLVKILFTDFAHSGNWVYFSDDLAAMLGFKPDQHHWFRSANDKKEIYAK